MSSKTLVYIAAFIGYPVGSYIPALWGGAGLFSISSLIFGTIGAVVAIFLVLKFFE